jgi:hypothetical protein
MELENKKVVLIGGSHGMGLGTAKSPECGIPKKFQL